jgi:hypothetical protein
LNILALPLHYCHIQNKGESASELGFSSTVHQPRLEFFQPAGRNRKTRAKNRDRLSDLRPRHQASNHFLVGFCAKICSKEQMRANRLQNALPALGDAMREMNVVIEEMRAGHDPLAATFSSRAALAKTSRTPRAANGTISRRASVGSRRVILGFAATCKSGNDC